MVNLIPELCSMTGLTDAMRQDFRLMKVGVYSTATCIKKRSIQSTKNYSGNKTFESVPNKLHYYTAFKKKKYLVLRPYFLN